MGNATNTKDFIKIDSPYKSPNNHNTVKTFIKEDGTMWGIGSDWQEYPFATAEEKVSYGKLMLIQWQSTPSTQSTFLPFNTRKAPHLINSGSFQLNTNYDNCLWAITKHWPNTHTWYDLKFSSAAEVYAFVLDNAWSISGWIYEYDFTAEVYDKIDANIPAIPTLYWYNMFYSMLKGRKNYKKTMSVLDDKSERADYDQWIQDAIRTVTPYTIYTRIWWDGWNQVIWTPASHKKIYWLLREDWHTNNYNGIRYTTDGTSIITNASWPIWDYYIDQNESYYCRINMSGSSYGFINKSEVNNFIGGRQHNSYVVLYRMFNWTNYSIFVKPVWIDLLSIPYFDISKYDLYWYMDARNRRTQIKKITIPYMSDVYTDAFRIPLTSRSPLKSRIQSVKWFWESMSMRFMLKDKVTGKISPLSKAKIVWSSKRDRPVSARIDY